MMLETIFNNIIKQKTLLIIILCAIIGLFFVFNEGNSNMNETKTNSTNTEEYTTNLENKLEGLINEMSGVSSAKVLITLEQTNEYIYASDDSDSSQKHVVVNEALVYVTENLPKIKGVAIVCKGGNNDVIKRKITELACSLLGIYSTSVYVTE